MKHGLTLQQVCVLLHYNAETGIFTWCERPLDMFSDSWHHNVWNKRFSGKEAGNIHSSGYCYINIEPKAYLAHRLAWLISYGSWPIRGIDHINGCRSDNRLSNLRSANHSENAQNQKVNCKNTSGYPGVTWHSQRCKWQASIHLDGKKKSLGLYADKEEAYAAYLVGKKLYHTFNPMPRL